MNARSALSPECKQFTCTIYEDICIHFRYGSVMIMADQDHDGSHIKGLVVNLFDKFWPSLLKMDGFLKVFITPIVKVTMANSSMLDVIIT